MARYIDVEELAKRINKYVKSAIHDEKELVEWCRDECIRQAYCIPSADVVEVVRCKDCKHRNPYGYKCLRDNLWHDADDFCSYGKRKE